MSEGVSMKTKSACIASATLKMRRMLLVVLAVFCLVRPVLADQERPSRILILHSYHQGLEWTDGLQRGISRVFAEADAHVDLDIHYLDMARLGPVTGRELVEEGFVHHLTNLQHDRGYDLVLVSDNDALETVLRHRTVIAPEVPVVFCGVNNFSESMISGHSGITGIAEKPSFDKTFELAAALWPGLGKVLVLGEDTATGRQNLATLNMQMANASFRPELHFSTETDISALEDRLAVLTPEWAVLPMCRPFEGTRLLSVPEASARLSQASPVPLFAAWDFWMDHGPMGGVAVSATSQGDAAARLALRILQGEPVESIPVLKESPNLLILDQNALDRFRVPDARVPQEATIINRVPSFYEQHRNLVWTYGLMSLAGTGLCVLLTLNIVGRRKAEALLKRQLLFTETLLRAMPTPVFYKDGSRRYLGCNKAFVDFLGLGEAQIKGRTVYDLFPGHQGVLYDAKDREILLNPGEQLYEHSLETPRGTREVIIHKAVFADEMGQAAGIVGVIIDVTELHQAKERLSLAIAGSTDGIWDWDRVSDQVYFSPRWKEIIGYEDHELRNDLEEWRSRIHPEDRERVLSVNNQFFTSDASHFVIEYRLRHKDGSYRWVMGRGTCLRDRDGAPYRMAGSHADITDRKAMELELVAARDAALAASVAKSAFLANMSHEIRTPLNGIMSMLQLLDSSLLADEQKKYIGMAVLSGQRLTDLLSDILDISRIEAGKLTLTLRPFDLEEMRASIENLFSGPAREKGITLHVELDEDLPRRLMGDELRLRQILFNLVGNAIKFTAEGFAGLQIFSLPASQKDVCRILCCVSDSGEGIRDEALPGIFEPFVQGEGSYMRNHQGAGLGLSIVSRLVEMMGGALAIDNSETGTTICLSLPLGIPATDEAGVGKSVREETLAIARLRILLAEDDAVNMFAAASILEKAGHEVTRATDGAQVLELLRAADFDLVLMDIQMPVMDGLQATAAIRNDPDLGGGRLPIVAMTAYAMSGDAEIFLSGGMDAYVAKPLDAKALCEVIADVVSKKKARSSQEVA
jgi:PAS domain S-box-containing protein